MSKDHHYLLSVLEANLDTDHMSVPSNDEEPTKKPAKRTAGTVFNDVTSTASDSDVSQREYKSTAKSKNTRKMSKPEGKTTTKKNKSTPKPHEKATINVEGAISNVQKFKKPSQTSIKTVEKKRVFFHESNVPC